MLNSITWINVKKIIQSFTDNGDIVGLKEYITSNNLANEEVVEQYFFHNFGVRPEVLFDCFDQNNNFKISEYDPDSFRINYLLILYAYRISPSSFERVSELEKSFFRFCNKERDEGRSGDVEEVISRTSLEIIDNLDKLFDGNDWTPDLYREIYRSSNSINVKALSDKIKKHFSSYELKTMELFHKIEMSNNEQKKDKAEIAREISLFLDTDEIPKYVLVRGAPFKRVIDFKIDASLYKKIIFGSYVKELLYGDHLEKITPEEKQKIEATLGETKAKFFFQNDVQLNHALWVLGYTCDDLDEAIYLKDDKIYVKPEVVNRLIGRQDKDNILSVIGKHFEKERANELKLDDKTIYPESLYIVSKIYVELSNISRSNEIIKYLLKNLEGDSNLLYLPPEKLENLKNVLLEIAKRVEQSNAVEFKLRSNDLMYYILSKDSSNYITTLDKVEGIFNNDNLPTLAKKYLIFMILNPDLEEMDLTDNNVISPTLKNIKPNRRHALLFGDVLRVTLGTNNVNIKHYLEKLYYGNALYSRVADNRLDVENLPSEEKETLEYFLSQLTSLYNNTQEGRNNPFELTGNIKEDLNRLIPLFKPTEDYSLLDRIVRMYGIHIGLGTFKEVFDYMDKNVNEANVRGRQLARENFTLEEGDLVKGIGSFRYLYDILQNGSLCREFLGAHSNHDMTMLDTDLSMILKKKWTVGETMKTTIADGYGPIWFVIKKGKYPMTRVKVGEASDAIERGAECFTTLQDGHVGIRGGFPTTDIDYIMISQSEVSKEKVGFTIALNGIYIPVVDNKTGKLLFTPEQYDEIRSKMDGLSYFGRDDFKVSNNLEVPVDYDNKEIIEDSKEKRKHIDSFIENIMKEKFGYKFIPRLSQDIKVGNVQLIDTGSTGRGTNIGKKSDFDFILRVDEKANRIALAKSICEGLGLDFEEAQDNEMVISNGNLRLKGVMVPGIPTPIDMDITFQSKADKVTYTTDMALKDRLESIKRQNPDKYEDVLDNIIYAKQFLKNAGAYKPSHSRDANEGGLGGVGIENWILQNGGSFLDACQSFARAATSEHGRMIPFEEFKKKYKIYDFGENFYDGKHDEFVSNNMTQEGYTRMYQAIMIYLKENKIENNVEQSIGFAR